MTEELTELDINNSDAQGSSSSSWLDVLPEELKSAASLVKFKDVPALAGSYLEAEKALSSKVSIPKTDSSDEEWQKFYNRLGMPEDKKYTDKRNKEDEEYLTKYEQMFYDSGLSTRQGKKLLEHLYNYSNQLQENQSKKQEQLKNDQKNDNLNWLKNTYGNEFDSKMTVMQAALAKYGSKELANLIEEVNYSPSLIDLLVKAGSGLKSDSLITGEQSRSISSSEEAMLEIKRLEADSDFMIKLSNKNHTGHDEAVKRMAELYNIVYSA